MFKTSILNIVLVTIFMSIFSDNMNAQCFFDLESGLVSTGYNDVRIPGNGGTLFSLKDDFNPEAKFYVRLRTGYTLNNRHTFSLLYAPLVIKSKGIAPEDIVFEGLSFPMGTELNTLYKFNSYRLTYRYNIIRKPKLEFGLGFTAKIRDAKIALISSDTLAVKPDLGFVPIINVRFACKVNNKIGVLLEGDALGAKQGRAEDVTLALTYQFSDNVGFRAGYRLLEGGANVDEVYNFALFHYAALGFTYTFIHREDSEMNEELPSL